MKQVDKTSLISLAMSDTVPSTSTTAIEPREEGLARFVFEDESGGVEIKIFEKYDSAYSLFVWPCAPVLAQYLWYHKKRFTGMRILEIGSGTALPGIIAAKFGAIMTLSDYFEHPLSKELCSRNIAANDISDKATLLTLKWGDLKELFSLPTFDFIIASDCFYDQKDFDGILATVSFLLHFKCSANSHFYTTYQVRHTDWSIACLLEKWKLKCSYVDLETFGADDDTLLRSRLPGNHTIHLLEISLIKQNG